MSYARSPRPVDSITIGTSIICGSFVFTFTLSHSRPEVGLDGSGRIEMVRIIITRTGDTENRGSSRCGFLSGFYRGPHPVSNERALLRTAVLIVCPTIPVPDRTLHR